MLSLVVDNVWSRINLLSQDLDYDLKTATRVTDPTGTCFELITMMKLCGPVDETRPTIQRGKRKIVKCIFGNEDVDPRDLWPGKVSDDWIMYSLVDKADGKVMEVRAIGNKMHHRRFDLLFCGPCRGHRRPPSRKDGGTVRLLK